jgi:anti-anti-sigma regulatory factor
MQITISKKQGRIPITVLQLHGDIDGSNYTEAIQKAQELYDGGARYLVIDLSKVPFMSSAGLMAVHAMALIFAGHAIQTGGSGRPSFRALDPVRDSAARQHVKLLSPQSRVDQLLETVGLKQFFQVFNDLQTALDSF